MGSTEEKRQRWKTRAASQTELPQAGCSLSKAMGKQPCATRDRLEMFWRALGYSGTCREGQRKCRRYHSQPLGVHRGSQAPEHLGGTALITDTDESRQRQHWSHEFSVWSTYPKELSIHLYGELQLPQTNEGWSRGGDVRDTAHDARNLSTQQLLLVEQGLWESSKVRGWGGAEAVELMWHPFEQGLRPQRTADSSRQARSGLLPGFRWPGT